MTDLRPGVLLDVDGTLLDTNYLHVLAWWQAFHDTGHRDVTMAAIHRSIGLPGEGLTERLLGQVDQEAVEAHAERYQALREHATSFPAAADLVRACAQRGYRPVLTTSGKERDLEWMLPAIGARQALAGVATSSDVAAGKPAPDLAGHAMQTFGLDPARSLALGDTVFDVEAAARAGVPCVGLSCGGVSAAELREAGAVEVYDDPAGLLERFEESLLARRAG